MLATKEDITKEALKYDVKTTSGYKTTPSVAFAKGFRMALKMCLPFIQDAFRTKIERLLK